MLTFRIRHLYIFIVLISFSLNEIVEAQLSFVSSYSSTAHTEVFDTGKYSTTLRSVESVPPPKPLLIASPLEAGEFPLLLFLHGYLLFNSFYSQLIQHIASHGFIVIAPQLYWVAGPDTSDEIRSAAAITNWLAEGLSQFLPPNVKPTFDKLALAGHSRGGKTAFALALKKLDITTNLKFSALIGVDPVDGTNPPVLTNVPHSFDFDMAAMVIGTGLGEMKSFFFAPPCAPRGVNHKDFYNECQKPAWHFVAKDYGHLDMLDNVTKGIRGQLTYWLCKNGESRKPMRSFVGGVIVAFLKAYLHGDNSDLLVIKDSPETAPVELETPIDCYV